VWGWTVH